MKHYNQLIKHNGNSDLFKAIEMSIIALSNSVPLHIHAEGLRGTGKTTIMRSIKEMLPPIIRIKNCIYNCHPDSPHCPEHSQLSHQEITSIGTEFIPCPFLEISHAAKIGTVIGSIDLSKLTATQAMAAILPGTIPQAHRGIIFIDEINRLADVSPEVADVLLDVMGTKPGYIQIEEVGLPIVELPVSVTIWAASNPDEEPGPLNLIRKQLSDRFDFVISMGRPSNYRDVFNILQQRNIMSTTEVDKKVYNLDDSLSNIIIKEHIRQIIAQIYVDYNLESLRSIETMEIAASLSCLIAGRKNVDIVDLQSIVILALTHRAEKGTIDKIVQYLEQLNTNSLSTESYYQDNYLSEIAQELSITQQYKKMDWWKKALERLIRKMSFLNKFKKAKSHQEANNGKNIMSMGNMKIVDPAKVNGIAPPRKAVALRELPVEQFINSEDNKPNG